ncbi:MULTISPECIES: chalcone isomerase family protein [unclassified Duganella]|uniref:chalcone isomerase family protein n=1 Tax=unclassified Duganella TaxID=2636909 RepID=UPI0008888CF7|nr:MULTISPECIES: chalcone isomerase family protein [unclassified Duganella]SDG88990.1 Chalcone isomerase-like [Duganella sp. OV458]SDJ53112.1 Chalcone isomerase-like [Duganella sp. OV510]
MNRRTTLHVLAAAALCAAMPSFAFAAVDVAGVKFDETVTVAGQQLKLNGAGVRTKVIFKVYAAALYLTEKKTTVADVLTVPGPRRVAITMLREVSSEDFGKAFTDGINANTSKEDRNKILPQIMKFGEVFAQTPVLKKGDQLSLDWTPNEGTQCYLNGKKIGELMPDVAFYNAVLRIWLGDKPADSSLKPALLGEK